MNKDDLVKELKVLRSERARIVRRFNSIQTQIQEIDLYYNGSCLNSKRLDQLLTIYANLKVWQGMLDEFPDNESVIIEKLHIIDVVKKLIELKNKSILLDYDERQTSDMIAKYPEEVKEQLRYIMAKEKFDNDETSSKDIIKRSM